MLDKLHVVADYEGRSANSQMLVLIRSLIEDYEAKHGEIKSEKSEFDISIVQRNRTHYKTKQRLSSIRKPLFLQIFIYKKRLFLILNDNP